MTTLVIITQSPEYNYWETYSHWVQREMPACVQCGSEHMTLLRSRKNGMEIWVCDDCDSPDEFPAGYYGEDEIFVTREEWEIAAALDRQRNYLIDRYGTENPPSVRDYWQPKRNEGD